jgi:adenine-specific DNA-methyltransferase
LAYADTWSRGLDSFLDMLYPRFLIMKKLLSDMGSIYVHCDVNASHYIKIILDEIFGKENFRNEIIWQRTSARSDSKTYNHIHDVIFFYTKSLDKFKWQKQFVEQSESYISSFFRYEDNKGKYRLIYPLLPGKRNGKTGEIWRNIDPNKYSKHWRYSVDKLEQMDKDGLIQWPKKEGLPGVKKYLDNNQGKVLQSIWTDISPVSGQAHEKAGYPTQKPETLLERVLISSSDECDLVADFFCGSGTTGAVAERLGRRWIMSDLSKTAIQVTRGRLVNQEAKPFVIQNLGNYQRQLIYSKEVKLKEMYDIVLKLYGATPRDDMQGFGISKEDRSTLVYVCQPDRPMTGKKAYDLARMAKSADGKGYRNLVILAWDYDYDFDDAFDKLAKDKKLFAEIDFKIIPSDVYKYLRSSKAGDPDLANKINFYQKPYLKLSEPQVINRSGNDVQVRMKIDQYVVMDIPIKDESKRPEIERELQKNFANLIDYWTVDWDYDGEVFKSKWQAIRERKSAEPVPIVADATLAKGKKYKIAVRVVDVFGNDASMTKEIEL